MLPSEIVLTLDRKTNRIFHVLATSGVFDETIVHKGALARDAIFYLVSQSYVQVGDFTGNRFAVVAFRYIGS